jgi:hypothetical protein
MTVMTGRNMSNSQLVDAYRKQQQVKQDQSDISGELAYRWQPALCIGCIYDSR